VWLRVGMYFGSIHTLSTDGSWTSASVGTLRTSALRALAQADKSSSEIRHIENAVTTAKQAQDAAEKVSELVRLWG
jgi:hypothetical protein